MRILIGISMLLLPTVVVGENWPQWRGPLGTGLSTEKGVPAEWSVKQNVAWRSELAGLGVSSPIVWGNQVFTNWAQGHLGRGGIPRLCKRVIPPTRARHRLVAHVLKLRMKRSVWRWPLLAPLMDGASGNIRSMLWASCRMSTTSGT